MKAKVQYNDLVGTAAADISDYYLNSLNEYLTQKYSSFDGKRYRCVGCVFYTSYGQYPSVRFVCCDVADSTYHLFIPEQDLTLMEFFELFKRFRIVIGNNIDDIKVDEKEPLILSNSKSD